MITAERLLAETAETVGLDDFGHPSFRTGLEQLLASAAASAELTPVGEAALEATCRGHLVNRLKVTDHVRRHPEVLDTPIEAPIVIIGLARTGTTALSHLLGADPALRSLRAWEATDSVPPPTSAGYWADPRYLAARDAPDMLGLLNPGFKAIHHDPPEAPIECSLVLAEHFASVVFSTMFTIPDYDAWHLADDLRPAYDWHRRVLSVLQSGYPGRWQLKSPVHNLGLDALHATYPDARYVVTHRDPVRAVASVCSLVASLSGTFTDVDHRAYIASHWPEMMGVLLDRQMAFRRTHDDACIDVAYADLVADPLVTVQGVYDRLGLELAPEREAAIAAQAAAVPQHHHGRHEYSLAEFGLRREALEERFAEYLARFDVPREAV